VSFRLRPRKSITRELRRLARKQLRNARGLLQANTPPDPNAVHEARKSLKKVRTIIQLIDADEGRRLDGSTKRLRRVAHMLSRVRDADAMQETVETLHKQQPRLLTSAIMKRLKSWMSARRRSVRAGFDDATWTSVEDELRALRRKARHWRPSHRDFSAIAHGIETIHRRGRKALKRAMARQMADDFHRWRKQIKSLWYGLRLLQPTDSRLGRDIRALRHAEQQLGNDHNVVVLCSALSKDDVLRQTPLGVDQLKLAADRQHLKARKTAIAAAQSIYQHGSRQYARHLKRMWSRRTQ